MLKIPAQARRCEFTRTGKFRQIGCLQVGAGALTCDREQLRRRHHAVMPNPQALSGNVSSALIRQKSISVVCFHRGCSSFECATDSHEGTRERVPTSLSTFSGGTTGRLSTTITLSKPRSSSCASRGLLGRTRRGRETSYYSLLAWSTRRVTVPHVKARRLRSTLCMCAHGASGAASLTRTPPKTQIVMHARTHSTDD